MIPDNCVFSAESSCRYVARDDRIDSGCHGLAAKRSGHAVLLKPRASRLSNHAHHSAPLRSGTCHPPWLRSCCSLQPRPPAAKRSGHADGWHACPRTHAWTCVPRALPVLVGSNRAPRACFHRRAGRNGRVGPNIATTSASPIMSILPIRTGARSAPAATTGTHLQPQGMTRVTEPNLRRTPQEPRR